ncbi:MAG: T9SS type A sorting domain-containing protein [Bacteroidales bacterium]|nr:T9SS type A sorting domain-containing protein [Bacteroidales bacterium]MDD3860452.1 T9SS type A sorting domain-containing protein [Bacteroidales bacterium]
MKLKLVFWAYFVILSIIVFGYNSISSYEKENISIEIKKTDTQGTMLLEPAGPFCTTEAPVNLIASVPDGTWSGVGITDVVNGIFDPSVAGAGNHTITYVSSGGTETMTIQVDAAVDATIFPAGPFCENDPPINLSAASPGGFWSGTGIVNETLGTFVPAIAGPGSHVIQYNVVNGACSDFDNIIINVYVADDATIFPAGPFCENDPPINLSAASPGGFWSGTGIVNETLGTFDPSLAGPGTYFIQYNVVNGACSDSDVITITVAGMDATITPVGPFCENDPPINLTAASPGGSWSGMGIIDPVAGMFDPSFAGPGVITIQYDISIGDCSDSDNISLTVNMAPDGTINDPGEFCSSDAPINLTASTPDGSWEGPGITSSVNGTFDPSLATVGDNVVNYQVTNGYNCDDYEEIIIAVYDANTIPVITSVNQLYIDDSPVILTADIIGGIWSGNGISDPLTGSFDPSVAGIGLHTIIYYVEVGSCNWTVQTVIHVTGINIFGYLYNDINANCVFDEGEAIPNRLIYANPGPFYAYTDEDGYYKFFLNEGAYTVHSTPLDYYSISCPENGFQNIIIENTEDTLQNINLGLSQTFLCPLLNVSVVLGATRPCFHSTISIHYSNVGTIPAENAYIDVELNPVMTYVSSTIPYSSINGNVYRFELGNIDSFEFENFAITVYVDCDLDLLGQTSCVSANIFPNSSCETDFGNWDHSSVSVDGYCQDNLNACFSIINTGDFGEGDMQNAHEYRIFSNDSLIFIGTFQLQGGENTEICWATNGSAIRLEADQHPEHPGNSHPQFTIEACGDANGTSYGYITTTPYNDEAEYVDIDCRVITGSWDPNDKIVHPSGITDNNYFEGNRELTYLINFQNTGTDTAFTVVVVDTIDSTHDMMTFERGVSSHHCELEIYDDGILVWTFNDILLPDSTTNEPESHGFVTYTIMPVEMSEEDYGTEITNNAAIYFDYNPPIITNTTRLTFWELPLIITEIISGTNLNLSNEIFPNPTNHSFTIKSENTSANVQIFDLNGKLIKSINDYSGEKLDITSFQKGIYFVKLTSKDNVSIGKLVVE